MNNHYDLGIIGRTDSYKFAGHWKMMRPGTEVVNSYLESRGGRFPKTIFFGLQYYLKKYLSGKVVTPEQVERAREFATFHLGTDKYFNYDGWMYIATELGGKLPLEIKAVPEGVLVSTSNILVNVKNTDKKCGWLVGYVEGLLMKVWYPITIASNGFYLKLLLKKYFDKTSDEEVTKSIINFEMHDFSYRSCSSEEQSGIGGGAHLLNYRGTDNIQGILFAQDWYNAQEFPGYSVAASEHSISTAFGRGEGEREYVLNLLKNFPDTILSIVADTYNVYEFVKMLCEDKEIRELILSRPKGNHIVPRPDSGYPPEVLSKILDILWHGFGGTYNSKGYKVINPAVRIIQGDGIDFAMTEEILQVITDNGYAADNLVFGSGSALMNKNFDRDTNKFAFKNCFIVVNGEVINTQKDPFTSLGKKSKIGELKLTPLGGFDGEFMTISSVSAGANRSTFDCTVDALKVVFLNGEVLIEYLYDDIKKKVDDYFRIQYNHIDAIDFSKFHAIQKEAA